MGQVPLVFSWRFGRPVILITISLAVDRFWSASQKTKVSVPKWSLPRHKLFKREDFFLLSYRMTELIACLSTGKGTLGHVARVIEDMEWNKIFLITSEFAKDKFKSKKNSETILIDTKKTITEMSADIKKALEGRITDLEVALNIVSGDGREHTAVISALLQLGLGIRLVALTKEGVKVI